jgi:hypothetical protein
MTSSKHAEAESSDVLHADQLEKPADLLPTTDSDAEIPAGYFPVTAEEKAMSRALNVKFDIFLLPFMSLLYLFNGLDRGNVGNAQTQGLQCHIFRFCLN